ncbi:hypothetical protein FB480_102253 [Agrobacterium vitis]|nr:hypothetical protein FB480_102253 [Agrobacterium vitis]
MQQIKSVTASCCLDTEKAAEHSVTLSSAAFNHFC